MRIESEQGDMPAAQMDVGFRIRVFSETDPKVSRVNALRRYAPNPLQAHEVGVTIPLGTPFCWRRPLAILAHRQAGVGGKGSNREWFPIASLCHARMMSP